MATPHHGDERCVPRGNDDAGFTDEETPLLKSPIGEQDVLASKPRKEKLALVVGSTFIGVFLGAIDVTIIATLAAPISTSLGSLSLLSWVASAYIIANAACQPLLGRLTDIYGRRSGLVVSNLLFATGNLVCGLAANQGAMILGRAVAGLGGGGMMAISNFIASDLVPLRKRGLVQGVSNLVFGVGCGLGGLFGGFINDTWGWRVAFLIQVPFALISTILVYILVAVPSKQSDESKLSRVDFLGAFTLTAALILLLLGLNLGGGRLGFRHPLVLSFFGLSILGFCAFVWVEAKWSREPILPMKLMLRQTIAMANLNNWFTLMVVFTVLIYIPIWFQVRGSSTTAAGSHLISHSVGVSAGALGSGYVMRWTGKYLVLGVGLMTIFVLGNGILLALDLSSPVWLPTISLAMIGFGYGGIITVNLLASISSLGHEYQAVITSSIYVFRSTGSAIGVTIASVIYENTLTSKLWKLFGDEDGAGREIKRIVDSFDEMKHLPPHWRQAVLSSCIESLHSVFITCLVLSILAFGCQIFVRQHQLHSNLERN